MVKNSPHWRRGINGHNLALELKRKGAEVSIVDGLQINNFLNFSIFHQQKQPLKIVKCI